MWWYRHARAIGGVGNILMLMTANLVGFVIGLDGLQYLGSQLIGTWSGMDYLRVPARKLTRGFLGIAFLLVACACLFIGVQIMLEYREEEKRQGIYRKC